MAEIPVSFEYRGKVYSGILSRVPGAGAIMFHLMINNYYHGKMFLAEYTETPWLPIDLTRPRQYRWRFTSQNGRFEDMVDFFEDVLIAWYQ